MEEIRLIGLELRKDLRQLEATKDKDISTPRHWERLERKYNIRVKRLNVVTEELKQRITAIAARVRRYQGQIYSYRQYRLLVSDWHRFFLFLNLFIIFCKFLLAHVCLRLY